MNSISESPLDSPRKSSEEVAALLIRLFGERFGGVSTGRFRISRKYLRKLAGRRKLPDKYLRALADEVFEFGYVLVDCESYSIVLSQKQFSSYRRVTDAAANKVLTIADEKVDATTESEKHNDQTDVSDIEQKKDLS